MQVPGTGRTTHWERKPKEEKDILENGKDDEKEDEGYKKDN